MAGTKFGLTSTFMQALVQCRPMYMPGNMKRHSKFTVQVMFPSTNTGLCTVVRAVPVMLHCSRNVTIMLKICRQFSDYAHVSACFHSIAHFCMLV